LHAQHTLKRLNFMALACSFRNFNGVNYLTGCVRKHVCAFLRDESVHNAQRLTLQ
jgi:hypothetical protein